MQTHSRREEEKNPKQPECESAAPTSHSWQHNQHIRVKVAWSPLSDLLVVVSSNYHWKNKKQQEKKHMRLVSHFNCSVSSSLSSSTAVVCRFVDEFIGHTTARRVWCWGGLLSCNGDSSQHHHHHRQIEIDGTDSWHLTRFHVCQIHNQILQIVERKQFANERIFFRA